LDLTGEGDGNLPGATFEEQDEIRELPGISLKVWQGTQGAAFFADKSRVLQHWLNE